MPLLKTAFAPIILLAVLLSCNCCYDPSGFGNAPYAPEEFWIPDYTPNYHLVDPYGDVPEPEKIEELGPLRLRELVDIALRNNPRTFKSWADARSAAFTWEIAKSPYYPVISDVESLTFIKEKFGSSSASSASSFVDVGVAGTDPVTDSGSTAQYNQEILHQLTLSYLLMDFGGRDAVYESTRQALISADWAHNRVMQDVIVNVMRSYVNYMQNKALLEAKEAQLKDAQTSTEAADSQFKSGVKSKVDYLLAKSNLVNVELQLEQLRGQVKISMGVLAASLGFDASTLLDLAPLPKELPLKDVDTDIEELMEIAMAERPDLSAVYANYYQKKADVVAAWSEVMPTINALGNIESFTNIHVPSQNGYVFSAGIEIDIPIFAGYLYQNRVRRAQEDVVSALASIEDKQTAISLEVVTSYYTLKTAVEALKYTEEYLKYSQESFDAATAIYQNGTGTILDLLTAQTALANARAQNINAKAAWLASLADLAYATGVLMNDEVGEALKRRAKCG